MVPQSNVIADIGSDHALLPIALVLNGKVTRAYASEVNEGPYEASVKNIEKYGVGNYVSAVLSNGISELEKDVEVYGRFYEDKESAIKTLKFVDNNFDYESVYNMHHSKKKFYEGGIRTNLDNLFLSLYNSNKDDEVYFIFNNPPSVEKYIGGLGTINSVSRGREHNPCVQFAIMSRKVINRPDGEIYNSLSLGFTNVDFDTPVSELIELFKRLYVLNNDLSSNLTPEQKESIIENKLKYYFNEIVDANMFRFAKISNYEDDVVYKILKENNHE